MILLPIVERELRVSARDRRTARKRLSVAIVAAVFGAAAMIAYNIVGTRFGNLGLFSGMTSFVFIFCIAAGIQSTFDCLSEEKREGTLGLLFLTDLKGYDIIFGKLAATALASFFGLLAAFPVFAILIPIGRVQAAEFLRTALCLMNVLLLSHAIGLFVSSISRKRKNASLAAFALILLFWAILPGLAEWLRKQQVSAEFYTALEIFSPSKTAFWAAASTYGLRSNRFWESLFATHLLAWCFLGAASLLLPRVWQDKAYGARQMLWRERFKQWCYGNARVRAGYRQRLVNKNPIFWLIARDRLRPLWVWVFLAFLFGFFLLIVFIESASLMNAAFPTALVVAATVVLKVWIASEVSRAWVEERAQNTLELIFSTPISARAVVKGQRLALNRQFLWPFLAVTLAQISVCFFGLAKNNFDGSDRGLWIAGCIGYTATTWLDVWALMWLAIWSGLTTKNLRFANSLPIGRILGLPSMIWYAFFVIQAIPAFMGGSPRMSPGFNLALWFCLGVLSSVAHGLAAQRKLLSGLREAVARVSAGEKVSLFRSRPMRWPRAQMTVGASEFQLE